MLIGGKQEWAYNCFGKYEQIRLVKSPPPPPKKKKEEKRIIQMGKDAEYHLKKKKKDTQVFCDSAFLVSPRLAGNKWRKSRRFPKWEDFLK